MNHDKREKYLLFENQTGFFLDQQDFQSFSRWKILSFWPKLEDDLESQNLNLKLICFYH